ncbi:MAG: assimilatory sulfite reductase (NADPH) flavoprotein subunit [Halofilum sp. (in: g-proteobacteria)]|nr:assimilatory sulfite reductase (NADPH) flavoprotein subunit [Halofilum sp. (in: g-proteobacteria)]
MHSQLLTETNSPLSRDQAEDLSRLVGDLRQDQLNWLSGYLAGLSAAGVAGAAAAAQASTAAAPAAAPELTILVGSQTGNAEEIAQQAATKAEQRGFRPQVVDMGDVRKPQLKAAERLLVIVSTHGEGDPPDNAIELHELVGSRKAPPLGDTRFSVLALGDASYEHFCQTGRDFDARLEALGGTRIHPRADCDVDYDDDAAAWVDGVLEALAGDLDPQPSNVVAFDRAAGAQPADWSKRNPYRASLVENLVLNGRGSAKETRHLEVSVEGSGLQWEPGDSLGVLPQNPPRDVDDVVAALGLDHDETVEGPRGEVTLREALTHDYEITTLTRPFLHGWAELAGDEALDALLAEDNRDALREWMHGRQVIDVLRAWPVTGLAAQDFVARLRRLPPRLYSIASSFAANPDEIHLTVAAVRYEAHERAREGVASTFLADRVDDDTPLPVYIDHNRHFRLPGDDDAPMIMIGPGTGVAPFRAFLEEREARGAGGRNWLFFGDQHLRSDFLYQREWLKWRERGVLDRLDVAFSRDQDEKVYVQDRIRERGAELHAWLAEGAHVYVCGDAERMAPDVHQALIDVIAEHGGLSRDDAGAWLSQLQRDRRYQRDVY